MSKPSSIINAAFADEVAPPRKFKVKRNSSSRDEADRGGPSTRRPSKAFTEGQHETLPTPSPAPASDSTSSKPPRSAARSLSPSKLRRNVVETVTPMFSPVMKGLRRLSKSALPSPSPSASSRRASEEAIPIDSGHGGSSSNLESDEPPKGHRSKSAPESQVRDAFTAFSEATPKRWSDVKDHDVKPLVPPSGRFLMAYYDDDDDEDNHSRTIRPPGRSTSPATVSDAASSTNRLPPSGNSSATKPLSWSSHHSKQKTPSSSSAGSVDGNSLSRKPSSSSSTEMPPRPKRTSGGDDSNVDRRGVPRRPHRKPDEPFSSPGNTVEEGSANDPKSRPRRAHSATPRAQQSIISSPTKSEPAIFKGDGIPARSESLLLPSAASIISDSPRRHSTTSVKSSAARRYRSTSQEPNPKARPEPSGSARSVSEPMVSSPEEREKQRRSHSRSRDSSAMSTSTNTPPESPTKESHSSKNRPGAHRRSGSGRRHHSAPHSDQGEEETDEPKTRRGRKKPTGQTESKSKSTEVEASSSKPSSNRSLGRQRRSHHQQHVEEPADEGTTKPSSSRRNLGSTGDDPEKPESGRRLPAEDINNYRKNLDRETLEHVKNLKDEIKQMRMQRRKVKFGAEGGARGGGPPMRSVSEGAEALQQQYLGKSSSPTKFHAAGTLRNQSQPTTTSMPLTNAGLHGSNIHNPGLTGLSIRNESDYMPAAKVMSEFNSSIGALSLEDLDTGYIKAPAPVLSEREQQIMALQKQIKKTKKLIKRTTRDVWTERDEITTLQRKNWSIRKALMQNEGPPDSLTTLNMKIEKLLRQERELDLDADRYHEEKDALDAECAKTTKKIGEFKNLFDKLNRTIVPLLPVPEDAPEEIGPSESGQEPVSPLATPSGTNRQAFVPGPMSTLPPVPAIEGADSSETMEDSMHSTEADPPVAPRPNADDEDASLSLSHLRMAMQSA